MKNQTKEAEILYLDKVQPISVKFLAYPYIPLGKLILLIGDPGIGKSTIAVNIAASLSVGKSIFNVGSEPLQGKTIFLSAEDNIADTLKPRLLTAGADCTQIAVITNIDFDISAEYQVLENAICQTGARFIVIDPLAAFIGRDADMCRAADMRRMMGGLAAIAEKYECAIMSISHLTKASGMKNIYRGLGSIDIAASARSVILVERLEDDPDTRLVRHIKSSLAPEGDTLAFQIGEGSEIDFLGKYEDDFSNEFNETEDGKRESAINIMRSLLSNGAVHSIAVQKACAEAGISGRTVNRAKKDLDIRSIRKSDGWYWTID